jgi:urate oxidase
MSGVKLATARYGKDKVRLCKVIRDRETGVQTVVEMTIRAMLEGEIDIS